MNKSTIVVSDTGPIISLSIIDKLDILDKMFDSLFIPKAVYNELLTLKEYINISSVKTFFKNRVKQICSQNNLILGYVHPSILYHHTINA